jgi:nucleotide-binding universal stress UspA family protein
MYKKVLVPLDGSTLAEFVLSHVGTVVEGCSSEITYLRVVEPAIYTDDSSPLKWQVLDRINAENHKAADQYLTEIMSRIHYDNVQLRKAVIMGKPTEGIIKYAEQNDIDLIILATHGRSGVRRLVWGSVAEHVLRTACVPILMIRPPGCGLMS